MSKYSLGVSLGNHEPPPPPNQNLRNGVLLQIRATPVTMLKYSKVIMSRSREKEKFLSRIFKIMVRRRLELLLWMSAIIMLLMILMFAISKDEAIPGGSDKYDSPSKLVLNIANKGRIISRSFESHLISVEKDNEGGNVVLKMQESGARKAQPPQHPCEKFAYPPPPTDKKRTGPRPCPVCYLPVDQAMIYMPTALSLSPVLKNLTYVVENSPSIIPPFGGSPFGGYPTLVQRNESFNIRESMCVHCGFVKGSRPGYQTGFDIDDSVLFEMEEKCRGIVVASAIFGNYDIIQQPKNISDAAKRNVCFYMFVDEETDAYIKSSNSLDSNYKVGQWRLVVVHNLPYTDARRTGKVPKLLLHRLFPNARFSIWIDGKLELVVDPYQILERFLWRDNATFAISSHYKRFDVFEEAEANKAAGKYDEAIIDYQVKFYMQEGLTHYSLAKLPITSDVPEGCVIVREHIPITNLFTCLWFNEVDRFTSRDQISFSTVRDKIMAKVDWRINMFKDCERRNFVVQAYHRDILQNKTTAVTSVAPPVLSKNATESSRNEISFTKPSRSACRQMPVKHPREKRSPRRRKHTNTNLF